MSIEHGIVYSFKKELALGTHDFDSDTFKMALYESEANLTLSGITAYTATGECSGPGYSAGGFTLAIASGYPKQNETAQGDVASGQATLFDFDNLVVATLNVTAEAALIYNSSKSNKAVCIIDFGTPQFIDGNFTFAFPLGDALHSTIRIL